MYFSSDDCRQPRRRLILKYFYFIYRKMRISFETNLDDTHLYYDIIIIYVYNDMKYIIIVAYVWIYYNNMQYTYIHIKTTRRKTIIIYTYCNCIYLTAALYKFTICDEISGNMQNYQSTHLQPRWNIVNSHPAQLATLVKAFAQ